MFTKVAFNVAESTGKDFHIPWRSPSSRSSMGRESVFPTRASLN